MLNTYLLIYLTDRMNGYGGANTRRRMPLEKQGPTVVYQKPGLLQTIFDLLPDEVPTEIKFIGFY